MFGDIWPQEISEVCANKFQYRGDTFDLDRYIVFLRLSHSVC